MGRGHKVTEAKRRQWGCKSHGVIVAFPVSVLLGVPYHQQHGIFGLWPILISWKRHLEWIFFPEFFCGYCLGIWLSVCKRISLDDHYFMWILAVKVDENSLPNRCTSNKKKGKKYQYSENYSNYFLIYH